MENRTEIKKWFNSLGFRYLIFTVITMAAQMLVIKVFEKFLPDVYEKYSIVIGMAPIYVIAVPISYAIISAMKVPKIEKQKFTFKQFIACFSVTITGMYAGNIVGTIFNMIFSGLAGNQATNQLLDLLQGNALWQNFLIVVICAPICEELIFRKLLVERLRKFGDLTAIIISGLAFGLFHGNITQFVYATLIGFVLAYVFLKSGNILYSILIHMIVNFNGSILSLVLVEKSGYMELMETMATGEGNPMELITTHMGWLLGFGCYLCFVLGFMIVGLIVFLIHMKKLNLQPGEVTLEKGKRISTVVANPGVILYIVVWIVMMVIAIVGAGGN